MWQHIFHIAAGNAFFCRPDLGASFKTFWKEVVHKCTIFLCSLDVRDIVQGGDPLYAVFFSTQGSGGYT